MKIRTDFVTNSSSSSFVVVNAKNPVLLDILKKHEEFLQENWYMLNDFGDNGFALNMEEGYIEFPSSKEEIVVALASAFYQKEFLGLGRFLARPPPPLRGDSRVGGGMNRYLFNISFIAKRASVNLLFLVVNGLIILIVN